MFAIPVFIDIYKFIVKHVHDKTIHYTYQPPSASKIKKFLYNVSKKLILAGSNDIIYNNIKYNYIIIK